MAPTAGNGDDRSGTGRGVALRRQGRHTAWAQLPRGSAIVCNAMLLQYRGGHMSFLVEREVRELLVEAFARTGLIGRDNPAAVPRQPRG